MNISSGIIENSSVPKARVSSLDDWDRNLVGSLQRIEIARLRSRATELEMLSVEGYLRHLGVDVSP